MAYRGPIPDSPIAPSMLPQASQLTKDDILLLTQPNNPIGQKSRSLTLENFKSSGILSDLNIVEVEFSESTDVPIPSDKPYTIILLNNKQNVAETGLTLLPERQTQDVRSLVDVVVNWRDQDTEPIKVNIGNGYYLLHPQNNEWGRFFIGAEGRCWSHQISVEDHTIGDLFSGSGTVSGTPREWELGNKGFSFKASISGTDHEVVLSVKNGNWTLEGLDRLVMGGLVLQQRSDAPSYIQSSTNVDLTTGYSSENLVPYPVGTMVIAANRNASDAINVTYYKVGRGTSAPSNYSGVALSVGNFLNLICIGVEKGTDNLWRPVFDSPVPPYNNI